MTDTPRTDAEIQLGMPNPTHQGLVSVEFARELERENAALKAQVAASQTINGLVKAGDAEWMDRALAAEAQVAELRKERVWYQACPKHLGQPYTIIARHDTRKGKSRSPDA